MPVVWEISAIHLNRRTLLSGVLLCKSPFNFKRKTSSIKNAFRVVRTYFADTYRDKEIDVAVKGTAIRTATDGSGGFSVLVDFLVDDEVKISVPGSDESLQIIQNYPVIFRETDTILEVISDIDDTVIISHTASLVKRVGTLTLKAPQHRKPVGFSLQVLNYLVKQHNTRVFYISKSESNLFGLLTTLIRNNKFPEGKLFLTPYLKPGQLIHPKKGRDYKYQRIRFLIENSANKRYVLLGDDTQKDMEVYTEISKEFPGRIVKIYIRKTRKRVSRRKQKMWLALVNHFPDACYFTEKTDSATEIRYLEEHLRSNQIQSYGFN
ncbi:MAG: phosphatase domain-containing protein [Bacteroidota bacterium]